jgi:hypothetical protein
MTWEPARTLKGWQAVAHEYLGPRRNGWDRGGWRRHVDEQVFRSEADARKRCAELNALERHAHV